MTSTSSSCAAQPSAFADASPKAHGLSNIQTRALTIIIVAPSIFAFGLYSKFCGAVLVFAGFFIAGVEWSGLKRHLKVALLLWGDQRVARVSSPNGVLAPSPPPSPVVQGVSLRPSEYPVPMVPLSFYNIIKHLGWACLAFAAYYGTDTYQVLFTLYFLIFVLVTLIAHNRLELKVEQAVERLALQLASHKTTPLKPTTTSIRKAQQEFFLSMELRMVAEKQPTEQLLDFCLDIFGLLWICGLVYPMFTYADPYVGIPWIVSTMLGNFLNDIWALVVGRTLRQLRERYGRVYDVSSLSKDTNLEDHGKDGAVTVGGGSASTKKPVSEANVLLRLLLRGPHQLYSVISPNKSVEGAVAGVLANAITFSGSMWLFYVWTPAPTLVAERFQSVWLWLLIGAAMGITGVLGDLLQSLLKRVARVKDAGFVIPGHGGVLDRIDGLLLVFPFMHCALSIIKALSA